MMAAKSPAPAADCPFRLGARVAVAALAVLPVLLFEEYQVRAGRGAAVFRDAADLQVFHLVRWAWFAFS